MIPYRKQCFQNRCLFWLKHRVIKQWQESICIVNAALGYSKRFTQGLATKINNACKNYYFYFNVIHFLIMLLAYLIDVLQKHKLKLHFCISVMRLIHVLKCTWTVHLNIPSQVGSGWLQKWFFSQTSGSSWLSLYPGSHWKDTVEPIDKSWLNRKPFTGMPGSMQEKVSSVTTRRT